MSSNPFCDRLGATPGTQDAPGYLLGDLLSVCGPVQFTGANEQDGYIWTTVGDDGVGTWAAPGDVVTPVNIYNTDGTLTGDRVVNQNNHDLTFTNVGDFIVQPFGTGGNGCSILLSQTNFSGLGMPGAGMACSGTPGINFYTAILDVGSGTVAQLGYSDTAVAGVANQFTATSTACGIQSVSNGFTQLEALAVDSQQANSYSGTGRITLETNELNLSRVPVTANDNVDLLSRNASTGAVELVQSNAINILGSTDSVNTSTNALVLASEFVLNPTDRTVTGGVGTTPASAANRTWEINSDLGNITAIGTILAGTPIPGFAEMHRNATEGQLAVGRLVTWNAHGLVSYAQPGQWIKGVVRHPSTCAFLAGDVPFDSPDRYLRDDYGVLLRDENGLRRENPDYDSSRVYKRPSEQLHLYTAVEALGTARVQVEHDPRIVPGTCLCAGEDGIGRWSEKATNVEVRCVINEGTAQGADRVVEVWYFHAIETQ